MLVRKKKVFLILLCVFLGIVVAYAETSYIKNTFEEVEKVPVLFAKKDIALNEYFTNNVEYKYFPENLVNSVMITDPSKLKGKVASRMITSGRPIFIDDITENIVPVLPEEMRTVTFATTLVNSLAGAIDIGDFIDIGFVPKQENEGIKAQVLFENVQIFNITDKEANKLGLNNEKKKENEFASIDKIPAAITVILSPEEAIMLKDYERKGSLFIMGRQ